jgi:hypothetical protein
MDLYTFLIVNKFTFSTINISDVEDFSYKYLGLSGRNKKLINCMSAGIAAKPSISLKDLI